MKVITTQSVKVVKVFEYFSRSYFFFSPFHLLAAVIKINRYEKMKIKQEIMIKIRGIF